MNAFLEGFKGALRCAATVVKWLLMVGSLTTAFALVFVWLVTMAQGPVLPVVHCILTFAASGALFGAIVGAVLCVAQQ